MMKKHRIVTIRSHTPAARFISNFFRNVVLAIISNFGIIVHHLNQTHQSWVKVGSYIIGDGSNIYRR
jgi:hypothetical protein